MRLLMSLFAMELSPTGTGYRTKTRFARFYNLPELMQMFREVADIQTADMLNLPVPEVERETVVLKPSPIQQMMVARLGERAEAIHAGSMRPTQDNMLLITNEGRKLALDQRLIDPDLPSSDTGKIAACAENVYRIWADTAEQRATQLIFCDLSTPSDKKGEFSVYDELKQSLLSMGIPPEEVVFIHSAKTEVKRQELFAQVNAGRVRVLIGSTAKMGAGMNVQRLLIAEHHLDCPWRPSDLQQREGRIIRQGNSNPKVKIFTYVTEGTFDAYLYQMVESKQRFIGQIMTSKSPVRSCEDVDETALSYAEIKALSAGDDRVREKMELDTEVARLRLLKSSFLSQKYALETKITKSLPQTISRLKGQITAYGRDIGLAEAHSTPDETGFYGPVTVKGRSYSGKKEAGQALVDALCGQFDLELEQIGTYRGFAIKARKSVFGMLETFLAGAMEHEITLGSSVYGNFQRLDHVIERLPEEQTKATQELEAAQRQLEFARQEVTKEFPQEEELQTKQARLQALNIELSLDQPDTSTVSAEETVHGLECEEIKRIVPPTR